MTDKINQQLLDALKYLLNDTQHKDHDCGDTEGLCPVLKAKQAISAAEQGDGWRSMDSAPKDGHWFLAWVAQSIPRLCAWASLPDHGIKGHWVHDNLSDWREQPTHWMPLPLPPQQQQTKGE